MELNTYLAAVRRRWLLIAVTLLVTMLVVGLGTLSATPVYEASTTLRVLTASTGSFDWVQYDIRYADRLMNTYTRIATSHPILSEVAREFNLDRPPQVSASVIPESELMQITVQNTDPVLARDLANSVAEVLIARSDAESRGQEETTLEMLGERLAQAEAEAIQARADHQSLVAQADADVTAIAAAARMVELREETYGLLLEQYETMRVRDVFRANTLSVVEPALLPGSPAKPKTSINLALGFLVGLAGGVALAFVFENLDTTLHTTAQIEAAAQSTTLAGIPRARRRRQVTLFDGASIQADAFRRLGAQILAQDPHDNLRTLLVASAGPQEGKSTTVANLAAAMAGSGRRVVVLDCDLRRPVLHQPFALSNAAGLSNLLLEQATLEDVLQASRVPGVWVLPSGPMPPEPAQVLASAKMARLVEHLSSVFDLVLLDAPAFQSVADAAILAPLVSGVLLVVRRGGARRDAVGSTVRQIARCSAVLVGVVVNRAEKQDGHGYYLALPDDSGRKPAPAGEALEGAAARSASPGDGRPPAETLEPGGRGAAGKGVIYAGE